MDSADLTPTTQKQPQHSETSKSPTIGFDRPIFIVSAPHSDSRLLFNVLGQAPELWHIKENSVDLPTSIDALIPTETSFPIDHLEASQASEPVVAALRNRYLSALSDRNDSTVEQTQGLSTVRLLHANTKNSLQIAFLNKAFPDALFIFLHQEAKFVIASIMAAWKSYGFIKNPMVKKTTGPWAHLRPKGWEQHVDDSVAGIAAFLWQAANQTALNDLAEIPRHRWTSVSFQELTHDVKATATRLCEFAGLSIDKTLRDSFNDSRQTFRYLKARALDEKVQQYAQDINEQLPNLDKLTHRLAQLSETSEQPAQSKLKTIRITTEAPGTISKRNTQPVYITESLLSSGISCDELAFTLSARGKHPNDTVLEFIAKDFGHIPIKNIDSLFGFVDRSTLYGGRPFYGEQLSPRDLEQMKKFNIGLRLPLTNLYVTREEYEGQRDWLEKYHVEGNAVITVREDLAQWIREDFPKFHLEASVIKSINSHKEVVEALKIYDTVVIPMNYSEDREFLAKIEEKSRIRLFTNAGCALNCPSKICYPSFSVMNKYQGGETKCSQQLKYRQLKGMTDFDLRIPIDLGYTRFKVLRGSTGGMTAH
jgi:hypothetical protein